MNILVVIPVYNHSGTIRRVVNRSLAVWPDVLVVDDGSTDAPAEALSDLNIRRIRHPRNLGKGAAVRTAARKARELGMTHILTLDADGQHDPEDIRRFIPQIQADPRAVLIGNRDLSRARAPMGSRFGKHFSNFWFRVQTGLKIKDTQCGFRSYPLFLFDALRLKENHYAFEVEILVKAAWAGVALKDVEIAVHYPPKSSRVSHFRPFMDNLRLTLLNIRLTLRSFIPWPHRRILETGPPEHRLSLLHPVRSLKTLLAQQIPPGKAAASAALGVFLGTLPLVGFHSLSILMTAGYLRLNRFAALAASQLCMPPIVPALCIETGYLLRHGRFLTEVSFETLGRQGLERLFEWGIGAMVLGPMLSAVIGVLVYLLALGIIRTAHER